MIQMEDAKKVFNEKLNFGQSLNYLRKKQDMTLRELAVKADSSSAYLSQLETGKRNPPKPDMLIRISQALGNDSQATLIAYTILNQTAGYEMTDDDVVKTLVMDTDVKNDIQWLEQLSKTKNGADFVHALVMLAKSKDQRVRTGIMDLVIDSVPMNVSVFQQMAEKSRDDTLYTLISLLSRQSLDHEELQYMLNKNRDVYLEAFEKIQKQK